jgi:hypothetical protein
METPSRFSIAAGKLHFPAVSNFSSNRNRVGIYVPTHITTDVSFSYSPGSTHSGSTYDLHDENVTESVVARSTIARDGAVTKWRCTVSYRHFVVRIFNGHRNFCSFIYIGQANALGPNILNYLQRLLPDFKAR